jgi:hypothetical protein
MRYRTKLLALAMLAGASVAVPAAAQVSFAASVPGLSIGVNVPTYPQLVRVPGYPVYYAPNVNTNLFFYDGMYWVYAGDNWYASSWYNGPWTLVAPDYVPEFILRVPVRYYRAPPVYFRSWRADYAPRWGEHWGHSWERNHAGWDHWDRRAAPAPAPIPSYQRQYSGNRYPHYDQQHALNNQYYRYQPRDPNVRQHYDYQQQAETRHIEQGGQRPQAFPSPGHPAPTGGPSRGAPQGGGKPAGQD